MTNAEKIQNVAEFQPILVTWHTPAYDSREVNYHAPKGTWLPASITTAQATLEL